MPRCVATCPRYRIDHDSVDPTIEFCGDEMLITGLCLPRIRELVAISRRRCDGCIRYECGTAMHGHCPIRGDAPPPDGVCENWEANP